MKLAVVDMHNKEVGSVQFADLKIGSDELISQALLHEYHNKRPSIAHTKTRGEVRGGGIKPWRQKGTGRARAGSSRSPLWRGGGVTFGPRRDRNFSTRLPQKMRALALQSLLALHIQNKTIRVVDTVTIVSGKTKDAAAFLTSIGINGSALIVREGFDEKTFLAFANITGTDIITVSELELLDLGSYSMVLCTKAASMQLFVAEEEAPVVKKATPAKKAAAKPKVEA